MLPCTGRCPHLLRHNTKEKIRFTLNEYDEHTKVKTLSFYLHFLKRNVKNATAKTEIYFGSSVFHDPIEIFADVVVTCEVLNKDLTEEAKKYYEEIFAFALKSWKITKDDVFCDLK